MDYLVFLIQQVNWVIILPILVSSISLLISFYTLWKIHLSPFKLLISFGDPTLRTYKITPQISGGKSTWFIPSIDIPFTFINTGAKSGKVINLRMKFFSKKRGINRTSQYEEIFEARWCVKYSDYNSKHNDRFLWLKESIENEWYPFYVLKDKPENKHIILESSRWDKFPKGNFNICLELLTEESNTWKKLKNYNFDLGKFEESQLKHGSSFCLPCNDITKQKL